MIDIQKVITIAKEAGKAILAIYETDFDVEIKGDSSPLTKADLASNDIIEAGLKRLTPDLPIMSEESKAIAYEDRKSWKEYWLVDPLDGTKEFIKKNGEFTVNIALIKDNYPMLGVVYLPVKDIVYYSDGNHSYKQIRSLPVQHIQALPSLDEGSHHDIIVVASRSHMNKETEDYINNLKKHHNVQLISSGSSLKFCLVAEGLADIYPRFAPTMEWDTAAAHAVIKTAGKNVYTCSPADPNPSDASSTSSTSAHSGPLSGPELTYNRQDLRNGWFIVK